LIKRVDEEISVSRDRAGRSRKRLKEASFELEPRVGHFDDDGELRPAGINPIERRAHALRKTLARARLGPRMRLRVRLFEMVGSDVRVDLRRAEVRMPEHRLDRAQIGTPAE
jgi:hypothetical protein